MYKKAGIIVGIAVIVIAIVIFLIANAASKSDNNSTAQPVNSVTQSTTQVTQGNIAPPPVSNANTGNTLPAPVQSTSAATSASAVVAPVVTTTPSTTQSAVPVKNEPVDSNAPVQSNFSLVEIDSATLPAYTDEDDVGTVVSRKVYAYNGQIVYSLLINTTTHGQLEYFTTLTNYNIEDRTMLNLRLRVFNASNGSYASIITVSAKQD